MDVDDAGVLPTPAVAGLVADTGADLGVVLSASHNPMPDNGIKFFAKGGHKLPDEVEDDIERRMGEKWERPTGADVGRVRTLADATDRYVARLLASPAQPARRAEGRRRLRPRRGQRRVAAGAARRPARTSS